MSNSPSRPRRKHLLNGRRVRISDLIDADLLKPGDEVFFQQRIGEAPHQATVTDRARLRLPDGREFTTPSRAGATVAGRRAVAGWSAWQVGRNGPTLHRLRLELLQDVANEVTADQDTSRKRPRRSATASQRWKQHERRQNPVSPDRSPSESSSACGAWRIGIGWQPHRSRQILRIMA